MNYQLIYEKLVQNALNKFRVKKPNDGLDCHHILPKSLGGTNSKSNLVLLTSKEHYLAHKLLVKIHKGEEKKKMVYALWWMSKTKKVAKYFNKTRISSRDYEYARKMFIEANVNNDTLRKEKFREKRMAKLYRYDDSKMGKTLSHTLNKLTPEEKRQRMLKSTMTANHEARALAIKRGKASLLEITNDDGSLQIIFSDETINILGFSWPHIKYRIEAHMGLLLDGKKVKILKKYTGGNKWKNK